MNLKTSNQFSEMFTIYSDLDGSSSKVHIHQLGPLNVTIGGHHRDECMYSK